ncbi:TetR/AcrR family transcriptional regulator [Paenibacillus caui]|uniref:TetR/AcrR family transcriptional regulator n=1 Tax=Paenibacillus caui TaxID=2873927 RepID=UPI001CA81612
MKQEERRQHTLQLLLDATKELIMEKGCQSITMKDIMERTGLSKGAIFHYVQSKDEIFAWILQEQLEKTNARFNAEIEQGNRSFDSPMQKIAESLALLDDPRDVTNKVLAYLLGREDQPPVAAALKQFYENSVHFSSQWIRMGQQHGVIPASVDTAATAEMFVLLGLGMRVRSSFPLQKVSFSAQSFSEFIAGVLKSK